MMDRIVRHTRALCPVCLKNLPAVLREKDRGEIFLERECPEHGPASALVWSGLADHSKWTAAADPMPPAAGTACPGHCGICPEHEADSCCVLLEVTRRCNLRCRFCFADGGSQDPDPATERVREQIRDIREKRGKVLLQFSGGEPTLRDDLPELVAFARSVGIPYVQVNTNGIRLAEDPAYVRALAEAGLDIVFLQFDGTREEIYETLRGKALLETKRRAIQNCGAAGIGVTLVPTVVPGVNEGDLGEILRFAASQVPAVRGVHFQPVSYFGRYPDTIRKGTGRQTARPDSGREVPDSDAAPMTSDRIPDASGSDSQRIPDISDPDLRRIPDSGRCTLDRLMWDLSRQGGIPMESLQPSRCDHPLCGFHARFLVSPEGKLSPLGASRGDNRKSTAAENREYVARNWSRRRSGQPSDPAGPAANLTGTAPTDFDTFLHLMRTRSLTLSAMAFQDAGNLNVERLHRCSLHVYEGGATRPFCAHYLTSMGQ